MLVLEFLHIPRCGNLFESSLADLGLGEQHAYMNVEGYTKLSMLRRVPPTERREINESTLDLFPRIDSHMYPLIRFVCCLGQACGSLVGRLEVHRYSSKTSVLVSVRLSRFGNVARLCRPPRLL